MTLSVCLFFIKVICFINFLLELALRQNAPLGNLGKNGDFDTDYKDSFLGLQRRGTLWFINESINMLAFCGLMPLNYFLSFRNWSDSKEKTSLKFGPQLFYGDCLQSVVAGNICKSPILRISV